jgi:hypothetical protein
MKKLMIGVLALAASSFAQTIPDSLRFHLSMPATVEGVALSTGDYTIRLADDSGNFVLSIQSETAKTHVLALANSLGWDPAGSNEVVLTRDGTSYRLDKIWILGEGYEIPHSAK